MRTPNPAFFAASLLTVLLCGPAGPAAGETVEYLVEGQLGSLAVPPPQDGGTFALRLSFDEPTIPDPDLSRDTLGNTGFLADVWSLDLFPAADGPAGRVDSDARPDALGYVLFTGDLTGFDSAITFVELAVEDASGQTLVRTTFLADSLVAPQFTNDLADLTADLAYLDGGVSDDAAGEAFDVPSATLTVRRLDDNPSAAPGTAASVVPSPTAVGGGLMLMFGLLARRRRATV
ncbi:MAG: hypothetical protein AAF800_01710 [Planctomycetota bacterium]